MTRLLPKKLERLYALVLSIGGLLGLVAMTWQATERITMLQHPTEELSCNVNPVVDCGGVLGESLAAVLGFPNAFLGMIFFTFLASSGLLLLAGGTFVKWYRHVVIIVSLILILFSGWFFAVSLYVLGKICLFCVVGWIVSIPIFWYGLLYYLQHSSTKLKKSTARFMDFGIKNHLAVVVFAYLLVAVLFLVRFREFYFGA
jgi:uncharacterized membrane protein